MITESITSRTSNGTGGGTPTTSTLGAAGSSAGGDEGNYISQSCC